MERNIEEYLTELVNNNVNKIDLPVDTTQINMIQEDLTQKYPEQVLQALLDDEVKENLVDIVNHEYSFLLNHDKELANYVVQECIGTGIIERILQDSAITDIGWNGKQLSVETNNNKWLIDGEKLNISQEYIDKVISKYAAVNDKSFNSGAPILDGMFKNIRISATHKDNSPDGATMSMRVSRPRLALNIDNFSSFAPQYIFDFFEKVMAVRANICISGETGTGKTELLKLLVSFIDNDDRIIMIEDVQESHIKVLFPNKDIYSWIITPKESISDLVKACLRNNPKWILVSETRGSEAYEMLQAVLSGHFVVTTLHAISAKAIPRRFVNMCASKFSINEEIVSEDIYRYFDFGVHIKKTVINGQVIRYLNEIVEFTPNGANTLFKQVIVEGKLIQENLLENLSNDFKERLLEKSIYI